MATWIFEPGHTEAEFRARHMMVSWVRGLFKDIHGRLELDWERCLDATFEGEIDAAGIWTGQPERDEHLRSADFFDVENHPKITFAGRFTERTGPTTFKGEVAVGNAGERVDENGRLTEPNLEQEVHEVITTLLADARSAQTRQPAANAATS